MTDPDFIGPIDLSPEFTAARTESWFHFLLRMRRQHKARPVHDDLYQTPVPRSEGVPSHKPGHIARSKRAGKMHRILIKRLQTLSIDQMEKLFETGSV